MTPEDSLDREYEVKRGDLAKQVLNNEVYRDAFLIMKADLLSKFEQSKLSQDAERREIWASLTMLNNLEIQLKDVMQTGQLAKKSLMQKVFKQ